MIRCMLIVMLGIVLSIPSQGQVGIGTTNPNASAQLDVNSSNKGFLPPRVALTSMDAAGPITSPATGLLVYNTATAGTSPNNVVPGYYYNSGTAAAPSWKRLAFVESDNTYKLASTGVANSVSTSQTISPVNTVISLNNSTLTVIVPSGYTDRRIILNWSVWGSVSFTSSANAGGSLRFQISQTSPSNATYSSIAMTAWSNVGQFVTHWSVPASYILENPAPGTYTFSLQINRESEAGAIDILRVWGISGTGQVFVR